ncbi:MAG: hypothetical protein JXA11_16190 [Phycisphaerae bacterium]|nr:hypothetical protein [Phycisphaerae bacterium]
MNEAVLREKMLELTEAISVYGDADTKVDSSTDGAYVPESSTKIDDVIDQLRLQIKYLMFDLEASRRENRYLRQMLEMRPPQSRKDRGEDDKSW